MRIQDIIGKKRDGGTLTAEEIRWFIDAYGRDEVKDYQASVLLMAIYLRGMNASETAALTQAMADSGRRLDLSGLPGNRPTLDKHSTGGVGDKTTLVVVPILAAAGVAVCKMSGRGLGHTGGTLDKLEAIPGFRIGLSPEEMLTQVGSVGACLAGQTADLAPADKKLYALRDATDRLLHTF
jgi:pyrimidine-nucleoside phosphorylase